MKSLSFRKGVVSNVEEVIMNQPVGLMSHESEGNVAHGRRGEAVSYTHLRKISGLAKGRTLVYFTHNGRKVPGAVLNDKE